MRDLCLWWSRWAGTRLVSFMSVMGRCWNWAGFGQWVCYYFLVFLVIWVVCLAIEDLRCLVWVGFAEFRCWKTMRLFTGLRLMTRLHCSRDSVLRHVLVTCSFRWLQILTGHYYSSTLDPPELVKSQFHRTRNHLRKATTSPIPKHQFILWQQDYLNLNFFTDVLYFQLSLTWFTDWPAIYWTCWAYFALNSPGQSFAPLSKSIFNFTTI